MRTHLTTAFALATLIAGVAVAAPAVAVADEFYGQQQDSSVSSASLDRQATGSNLSDPTAPNSIRSHGNR